MIGFFSVSFLTDTFVTLPHAARPLFQNDTVRSIDGTAFIRAGLLFGALPEFAAQTAAAETAPPAAADPLIGIHGGFVAEKTCTYCHAVAPVSILPERSADRLRARNTWRAMVTSWAGVRTLYSTKSRGDPVVARTRTDDKVLVDTRPRATGLLRSSVRLAPRVFFRCAQIWHPESEFETVPNRRTIDAFRCLPPGSISIRDRELPLPHLEFHEVGRIDRQLTIEGTEVLLRFRLARIVLCRRSASGQQK